MKTIAYPHATIPFAEKLRRIKKGFATEPFLSALHMVRFVHTPALSAAKVLDDESMTNREAMYNALRKEFPREDPVGVTFGVIAERLAASLRYPLTESLKRLAEAYFHCLNDAEYLASEDGRKYQGDHDLMPAYTFLQAVSHSEYESFLRFIEGASYQKNARAREESLRALGISPSDETSLGDIYTAFVCRNLPDEGPPGMNLATIRNYYGSLVDLFVIPIAEISQIHIDTNEFLDTKMIKIKEATNHGQ